MQTPFFGWHVFFSKHNAAAGGATDGRSTVKDECTVAGVPASARAVATTCVWLCTRLKLVLFNTAVALETFMGSGVGTEAAAVTLVSKAVVSSTVSGWVSSQAMPDHPS